MSRPLLFLIRALRFAVRGPAARGKGSFMRGVPHLQLGSGDAPV
jgi:hypothetical protein